MEFKNKIIAYAASLMPDRLTSPVTNYLNAYDNISEIRLRINSPLAFTIDGTNLITGIICSRDDIQTVINKMTDGNFFRNEEIMKSGYISLRHGLRAGVCGDAFVADGRVKLIRTINYINIRIPVNMLCECSEVIEHIKRSEFRSSILIFSPPCQGKTTLLRSIAYQLSDKPICKRVSVIDSACELKFDSKDTFSCADFLCGYPKAYGINLATKYLNPEYLLCDELGDENECEMLLEAMHSGVPLIATAHADSYQGLLRRKNIALLLKNGVFDTLLRLYRVNKLIKYEMKSLSELCEH